MRISIDRDRCIGSGNCVLAAPALFSQSDDDGTVIVLEEMPGEEQRANLEEAVETCPARVISIA